MIYVFRIGEADGGKLIRIVSDEPGSHGHRHVKLSLKTYITGSDLRSFDAAARTWPISAEARV